MKNALIKAAAKVALIAMFVELTVACDLGLLISVLLSIPVAIMIEFSGIEP